MRSEGIVLYAVELTLQYIYISPSFKIMFSLIWFFNCKHYKKEVKLILEMKKWSKIEEENGVISRGLCFDAHTKSIFRLIKYSDCYHSYSALGVFSNHFSDYSNATQTQHFTDFQHQPIGAIGTKTRTKVTVLKYKLQNVLFWNAIKIKAYFCPDSM